MIKFRFSESERSRLLETRWWEYLPDTWNGLGVSQMSEELIKQLEQGGREEKRIEPIIYTIDTVNGSIQRSYRQNDVIIFEEKNRKVKKGGVSIGACIYDIMTHDFEIRGWFLPSYVYDSVDIYTHRRKLGNAKLHCLRMDVVKNNPEYGDARAGWEFQKKIEIEPDEETIFVKCMNSGEIVHETSCRLQMISCQMMLKDFRMEDVDNYFLEVDEISFSTDESEQKIRSLLEKEFAKRNIQVKEKAENCIVCSLGIDHKKLGKKDIPFYVLLCFKGGMIDYERLKKIARVLHLDKEVILEEIKALGGG